MNTEPIVLDPTVAAFTEDQQVSDLGTTHFIGIGGAGMSVLAEMLHEQGVNVTGSDRERNAKTERLEALGIQVAIGQRADNVARQPWCIPAPSSRTIQRSSPRRPKARISCIAAISSHCS